MTACRRRALKGTGLAWLGGFGGGFASLALRSGFRPWPWARGAGFSCRGSSSTARCVLSSRAAAKSLAISFFTPFSTYLKLSQTSWTQTLNTVYLKTSRSNPPRTLVSNRLLFHEMLSIEVAHQGLNVGLSNSEDPPECPLNSSSCRYVHPHQVTKRRLLPRSQTRGQKPFDPARCCKSIKNNVAASRLCPNSHLSCAMTFAAALVSRAKLVTARRKRITF